MVGNIPRIDVCVCTFRRPALLKRLLAELQRQATEGLFSFSLIVVDNDRKESARPSVHSMAAASTIRIDYLVEPVQNIALARNRAISACSGDLVAFIDDDEIAPETWLVTLFKMYAACEVDGVLGPVRPSYAPETPEWVIRGRFHERQTFPTGTIIKWTQGRTGNVLLNSAVFTGAGEPFRRDFLTGEDQDFFRRMIESGRRFVWCEEAVLYEEVPPVRWTRSFLLRRALLRGKVSLRHPTFNFRDVMKSGIAVPAYACVLPFAFFVGHGHFMRYAVSLFDHIGRLLAVCGIDLVSENYVTD